MGYVFQWIIAIIIIAGGIAMLIFHFKMMYIAFKNGETGWGFLVLFFSFIGSVSYYFMKYKNRTPYDRKY